MRKLIVAAALLALPSVAAAQLPEPIEALTNPLVVAGANFLSEKPVDGSSQVRFFLTANVAGLKPFRDVPLYVGGIGVDIKTLPGLGGIGESTGAGLSIPGLTYAFAGSQAVIQVGYSIDLNTSKANGVYAGLGFSLTSPDVQKAKRIEKAKRKKASTDAGPPAPTS